MKYIKDFFYNYLDILFALVVALATVAIIFLNMNRLINLNSEIAPSENVEVTESVQEKPNVEVNIPTSATADQVADILVTYGILTDKTEFINSFAGTEPTFKTGTFSLNSNMTIDEIKTLIVQ